MQNLKNLDLEDYEVIESGHLSLNFSLKSLKAKTNPQILDRVQTLLSTKNSEKYINEGKLFVTSEGKSYDFNVFPEPSIGTTLYFSKPDGYLGASDRTFRLDLKNYQKLFEESQKEEQANNVKILEKNENKANLRLESLDEWLDENRPKLKRKKKEMDNEEDSEKNEKKKKETIKKPIRKRKKNINSLLNKILN